VVRSAEPLSNTKPLEEKGDLARVMVDGIHKHMDRTTNESVNKRKALWKTDLTTPEKYAKSIEPNRERLKKSLGVNDSRLAPKLEYVGGPEQPSLVAETDLYKVYVVRWAVLPGIDGEGLLIEPKDGKPAMSVVAIPDALYTPEQIVGLVEGVPPEAQFARRLAENHCRVLVPVLIDRKDDYSGNARLNRATNLPHREFVYRMAYEMGRTLIGFEIQKVLAAVDWLASAAPKGPNLVHRIGLMGHGDGGRIAFYAGALDDRVAITSVNGAFGPRESLAEEPIDRNVWGLLTEFGDAEIAAQFFSVLLAVPNGNTLHKRLIVEVNETPTWTGPQPAKSGRSGAAPGVIPHADSKASKAENLRAEKLTTQHNFAVTFATAATNGKLLRQVPFELSQFLNAPSLDDPPFKKQLEFTHHGKPVDPTLRQKRQFEQLVTYTQKLWRDSDAIRKDFWKKADSSTPEKWEQSTEWYRKYFHEEVIGKLPDSTMALNPRTRQIYDEPKFTGYEVVLDVYPDVIASGILLMPKDMKPGEKRPVVVCQHGLEGRPQDVCNPKEKTKYYNSFGAALANKGYIVYAPQNPYIFENHFRQIQRKANPLKLSLFSFIIAQHQRTIDWLETLPTVDSKKIAFYGLSYGGKTAMRVPAVEKRYCLSICAGDFNEWVGKNVSVDLDRSYMWTREYEMYEFDLGNTFNYAEMAFLIAPRPFMVERGHDDGVGTDEMVAYEYAKVRYLYANKLKLPDRTTIEFSPGGHEIFLKGTFAFLEQHIGKIEPTK